MKNRGKLQSTLGFKSEAQIMADLFREMTSPDFER